MKTHSPTRKLKIIPGRGLTGIDIKKRLRNRTLEGQTFGADAYLLDEQMDNFMKMSKTEQITAVRENTQRIKAAQAKLDNETNEKNKRLEEQRIEAQIKERMEKLAKEQLKNQNNA